MQPSYRPLVEPLENRDLLAAGIQAYVANNNLIVEGTAGNDYLSVTQSAGKLSVYGTQITVGNAKSASIDASTVSKVVINGHAGNDTLIASTLTKNVSINGGDGNDSLYSGVGNDLLDGGAGNDLVYAGAGNDRLASGIASGERDTLLGGVGFNQFYRPFTAGKPIVNGTAVSDIRQGEAPVCQTTAAMAEAVLQGHSFANDIKYLGNNVYDVNLYGNLGSQKVHFDGWTTSSDPVVADGEFWTVLLQRARLQGLGIDTRVAHTSSEWSAFNQNAKGRLFSVAEALYNFTGSFATYSALAGADPLALQAGLARGDYLVAQSGGVSGSVSSIGIVGNHAYAVLAIFKESGIWKIRLYNPWGTDRGSTGTIDSLDKSNSPANDGIITLSWSQFTMAANFKGIFVAGKK